MDDGVRWSTARRLLHDNTLRTEDRLAGLLLLLYAQWPAAVSRLTIDHIEQTDDAVRVRFGAVPVELPELVADLALRQVAAPPQPRGPRPDGISLAVPRWPARPPDLKWQRAAAGDFGTYAADISRRLARQN
ncbi:MULTISPECIES: hypothetical protein [unclassified Streptomyces]|uniref:hypothetical protein n=1 Tax=unclassified Streptomyces TaxID=2593676 RepID=UPI00081D71D7|nr:MULTISPECIES: hypothetical protein [unclassified Streptomyces]MYZ37978.1 hypothetical protein [Streptomyces sp. SID4917]SCF95473.1 hypothetical protein GA0115259_105519 [Streptomyces sp. MnatMP-M17]